VKKLTVFFLITAGLLSAKWYQVRVPLNQGFTVHDISNFDIVKVQPGYQAEIVVNESDLATLVNRGIPYVVIIDDLELYYESQMSGEGPFGNYYTLAEAYAILDSLHEKYPHILTERMILPNDDFDDMTWEGNHVYALKLSDNVETDEDEPEVLFTGLHHAREPISVNICVEGIRMFCEEYGSDPLITHLVDNREIWIVPIVNPDGYLYNESTHPAGGGMHRKNRNPGGEPNAGVDLNRNYPYMWGLDDAGSSPIIYEDTFRGYEPGSEPETQSVMNLCKARDFVIGVNYHSHANYFMYPWGHANIFCEDAEVFRDWGEASTRANFYAVMAGAEFSPTNGDAVDWMYGERTEKDKIYAVTIEVGDWFWEDFKVPRHLDENLPLLVESAKAAGVYLELGRLWWVDESGDGNLSPGEKANLAVQIKNSSVRDATGEVEIMLEGSDPRIDVLTPTVSIPSIEPREVYNGVLDIEIELSGSTVPDSAIELGLVINAAGFEFQHRLIVPVGSEVLLQDEDFDDQTSPGWRSEGWGFTTEQSYSGRYSITDSPNGPYPDSSSATFTSPVIDLSEALTAELSFWHRFATERLWDLAVLQVKQESDSGWVTIRLWNGLQEDWTRETFNLNEYCGSSSFQVRFLLHSNEDTELDGWYVDDVRLVAFEGKVTTGAITEYTRAYDYLGPIEEITAGHLNFAGPEGEPVQVTVRDVTGREVAATSGTFPLSWNLSTEALLPSGVYFIHTAIPGEEDSRKVVLTR